MIMPMVIVFGIVSKLVLVLFVTLVSASVLVSLLLRSFLFLLLLLLLRVVPLCIMQLVIPFVLLFHLLTVISKWHSLHLRNFSIFWKRFAILFLLLLSVSGLLSTRKKTHEKLPAEGEACPARGTYPYMFPFEDINKKLHLSKFFLLPLALHARTKCASVKGCLT